MAVLKQTSPTAWPLAPRPWPSSTAPSANTSSAVGFGSVQPESSCLGLIRGLDRPPDRGRQRPALCREQPAIGNRGGSVLRESISSAMKEAMKARDERRVSTLRLMNAAIQNADLDAGGRGKPPLNEAELMALFQKLIKQRQDSVEMYDKGGRADLAEKERAEIDIIASYLPKQMNDIEAGAAISAILQEINAQGLKDMGRAMGTLRERFAGSMDFGKASAKIKEL